MILAWVSIILGCLGHGLSDQGLCIQGGLPFFGRFSVNGAEWVTLVGSLVTK
jgi:hypothetical protein